jgi:hypothetical protein
MATMEQISQQIKSAGLDAATVTDVLSGGAADNEPDDKFNKDDLKQGQEHEKEHTDNKEVAKEIAKDHLKEDKQYYNKLEKMNMTTMQEQSNNIRLAHTQVKLAKYRIWDAKKDDWLNSDTFNSKSDAEKAAERYCEKHEESNIEDMLIKEDYKK